MRPCFSLVRIGFAIACATVQLLGCGVPDAALEPTAEQEFSLTGARVGAASLYPDARLTPGAVLSVTAAEVCTPGYSSKVRAVTDQTKQAVFDRYGIPRVAGAYEVDHFISLELGGSNDLSNLWPEPFNPTPGASEKDTVENYLHHQLCLGKMTLTEVQQAIRSDWYAVYLYMHGG
jgi:hypothetical protein